MTMLMSLPTIAQELYSPDSEVMRMYGEQIEEEASKKADEAVCETTFRYYVPEGKVAELRRYLLEREMRKSYLDQAMPDSVRQRVLGKMRVDDVYRDSVNMILIPAYVNKVSGDNVSYVLYAKEIVNLDDAQYSYLMSCALNMARRMYTNPRLNVWNEEMNLLRKTLTKDQLRKFFHSKNAVKVTQELQKAWKRLTDAGLTQQVDSVTDMAFAFVYYHDRQQIRDLYRFYGTSQRKYLAELDKSKPLVIKLLDGLDKAARLKKEEENGKTVGKEFVW